MIVLGRGDQRGRLANTYGQGDQRFDEWVERMALREAQIRRIGILISGCQIPLRPTRATLGSVLLPDGRQGWGRSVIWRRVYPLTLIRVCPPGIAGGVTSLDQPGHQSRRYRLPSRDPIAQEHIWSGWTLRRSRPRTHPGQVGDPLRSAAIRAGIRSGDHGYQIPRRTETILPTVSPPGDRAPDCDGPPARPTAPIRRRWEVRQRWGLRPQRHAVLRPKLW